MSAFKDDPTEPFTSAYVGETQKVDDITASQVFHAGMQASPTGHFINVTVNPSDCVQILGMDASRTALILSGTGLFIGSAPFRAGQGSDVAAVTGVLLPYQGALYAYNPTDKAVVMSAVALTRSGM